MVDGLVKLLVGIGIATVSSFITVHLAMHRFRTERWWEKKAEAYERVIEAFHELKKFASKNLDAESKGHELPDEQVAELNNLYWSARDEIVRASDIGEFVLSDEAVNILARYEVESGSTTNAQTFLEYLDSELSIAHRYMKELISEARCDLGK